MKITPAPASATTLADPGTPFAVVDVHRARRNIERLAKRADRLGVTAAPRVRSPSPPSPRPRRSPTAATPTSRTPSVSTRTSCPASSPSCAAASPCASCSTAANRLPSSPTPPVKPVSSSRRRSRSTATATAAASGPMPPDSSPNTAATTSSTAPGPRTPHPPSRPTGSASPAGDQHQDRCHPPRPGCGMTHPAFAACARAASAIAPASAPVPLTTIRWSSVNTATSVVSPRRTRLAGPGRDSTFPVEEHSA